MSDSDLSSNPIYQEWFPLAKYEQLTQLKTIYMAAIDSEKRNLTAEDFEEYLTKYGNDLFDEDTTLYITTICQNQREQVVVDKIEELINQLEKDFLNEGMEYTPKEQKEMSVV